MRVVIEHPHKCKKLATAPAMSKGREWWVGKLTEKITEYPEEEYCLHLNTPVKEVTFLCNFADFNNMAVLIAAVYEEYWKPNKLNTPYPDKNWLKSMLKISKENRSG